MGPDEIRSLPKAVLHDHVDGGLRVETVIDLADRCGHELPAHDAESLAAWFHQGRSGSLERYLEAFVHTLGVMQTAEAVERVSHEAVEDLAADGVVYAELRMDPGLCTRGGLTREDVIEAVLSGFESAERASGLRAHLIVCALRNLDDSELAAKAAVRFAGSGVVGFDLAGPEMGYPPDLHMAAIRMVREANLGLTLHAGEGDGAHSVWRALALCGAQRIGHGVHLVDETGFDGKALNELSPFVASVRDHRVPLEVCITSNLHTASYASAEAHPFGALYAAGFNVSLNTDNRLMSGVSVSDEYAVAVDAFGLSRADLGEITRSAIEAGFGPWPERRRLIDDVIRPAYGI